MHGGPDWDHSYLREPLIGLASVRHLLLPDLRGCGRSARDLPLAAYRPDAVVADLLGMLDTLEIDAADVLGFSYGGLLAQRLAVTAPHRVRSLVIASSGVLPVPADAYDHWPLRNRRRRKELAVWTDPRSTGPARTRAAAFAGASLNIWQPAAIPDYLNRLRVIQFSAEWDRARAHGMLSPARIQDPIRRLSDLAIPILLLHGRQDMIFPASLAERAAMAIPFAEVAVLDGAGHMTHIDAPEQWLATIECFLHDAESTHDPV
ncbi:alpha/beta fold hydrolase [Nocardia takedensis]|uniref:alpha/beta fold hydrolase n=1 Tax=Nocardia takedensis TaxID=259390 RepID=UPI003F75D8F8